MAKPSRTAYLTARRMRVASSTKLAGWSTLTRRSPMSPRLPVRVLELAPCGLAQGDGHRVDRKVPPREVVAEGAPADRGQGSGLAYVSLRASARSIAPPGASILAVPNWEREAVSPPRASATASNSSSSPPTADRSRSPGRRSSSMSRTEPPTRNREKPRASHAAAAALSWSRRSGESDRLSAPAMLGIVGPLRPRDAALPMCQEKRG